MKLLNTCVAVLSIVIMSSGICAFAGQDQTTEGESIQTTCPVMGGAINKEFYADVKGKRVYVCCPGCIAAVKKDPEKYIKVLEDKGVVFEQSPVKETEEDGHHNH